MDPNENLKVLRAALRDYHDAEDSEDVWLAISAIVEQAEALDGWLSRGGFLPDAWAREAMTLTDAQAIVRAATLRAQLDTIPDPFA